MARPQKAVVDYFPHDCIHGKTMEILEDEYGNNGYAFWFKLLERLGQSEHHYIDCRDVLTWRHLKTKLRVGDKADEMLDLMAELGAIDKELWEQKIIYCEKFTEGIKDAYSKRTHGFPDKEFVMQKLGFIGVSDTKTQKIEVSDDGNGESKVNEINNPLPHRDGESVPKKGKGRHKGLRSNGTNPRALAEKQRQFEGLVNALNNEDSYLNDPDRAKALLNGLPHRNLTVPEKRMVAEIQCVHSFSPKGISVLERLEAANDDAKSEYQKLLAVVKDDIQKARNVCRSG